MITITMEMTDEQWGKVVTLVAWGVHAALQSKLYSNDPAERAAGEAAITVGEYVQTKIIAAVNERQGGRQ